MLIGAFCALLFIVPHALFAQNTREFIPLVGVPGVSDNAQDFGSYANALYMLAIGIAVLIAVVKIIWAGVQYMFSEIVTSKENAKKEIKGALLGLLIILGAVIILETINPNLTNFNFLRNAEEIRVTPQSGSGGNACPSGQVWVECETDNGDVSAQCSAPNNTDWCEGTVVSEADSHAHDATNQGTWVVNATAVDGFTPAMRAAQLSDQCRREGGDPDLDNISDTVVRITCVK